MQLNELLKLHKKLKIIHLHFTLNFSSDLEKPTIHI